MAHPAAAVIDYLTAEELTRFSVEKFGDYYLGLNRPVVILNHPELCTWPAATKWTTTKVLLQHYGHLKFNVSKLPYAKMHGTKETEETLTGFLEDVLGWTGSTEGGAHEQGVSEGKAGESQLNDDKLDLRYIFVPIGVAHPFMADIKLPLSYVDGSLNMEQKKGATNLGTFEFYVGPALSGAQPHHHDAAWNALLSGKKRWFLWPATCAGTHGYVQHFGVSVWKWYAILLLNPCEGATRGCCCP